MNKSRYALLKFIVITSLVAVVLIGKRGYAQSTQASPITLSVRLESGRSIYNLNGRRVEDRAANSLLMNLTNLAKTGGTATPVYIIIDVQEPFAEAGKLETALNKCGFTHYRLFVSNFIGGMMNEIHWDQTGVPVPRE